MRTYDLSRASAGDLRRLLSRDDVDLSGPMASALEIIQNVRAGGDAALTSYAKEYDSFDGDALRVGRDEIEAALARLPEDIRLALTKCKRRIERFHARQSVRQFEFRDRSGVFGQRVVPLERVGVYVPGGTASYASSVLMACVPARVAGVGEIAMFSPAPGDMVLAAAAMCGVDEVYSVGGAQSIAAMAYGTETIRKVQKIVGPGGAFVSAAKLLVRNDCEIDFLAGPSEVLIIADAKADPELLAAEMLAQLEHDPLARAVLVSTSRRVIDMTKDRLAEQTESAQRREVIERSSETGAAFVVAKSLVQAIEFSNEYAPEHLVLDVSDPASLLGEVTSAGSVFMGKLSSVAFGDYCAGPNHILPTKGAASVRSSLSTSDFVKAIPYQSISVRGAEELSGIVEALASAEGLPGHARAAAMRRRRVRR